ncbi:DUF4259 domain-containing protein [Streptomyces chartreusis]|uniref:DUF4259 domain-containing protein n=1 Tax=Streptomyces chartreusis TaxID=1969 RepID=UPI0036F61EC8
MGTWDIGPFENDIAADFANDLDGAAKGERQTLIRRVLMRTAGNQDYLEAPDAEEAVAAAALLAAQCPGGRTVSPHYEPDEPVPSLPTDLSRLAVEALDRVLADESELSELWGVAEDGRRWRDSIRQMRQVLDPTPQTHGGALFEV